MTQAPRLSVRSALVLTGLLLLTALVVPMTDTESVLNSSFSISPGASYGPYEDGTVCHPRILGSSVLLGGVLVEGGGVYLTVNGHNTDELKDRYIEGQFSFLIGDAHEQYTFVFNNTVGTDALSVQLVVEEVWTRPLAFISPLATVMTMMGGVMIVVLVVVTLARRLKRTKETTGGFLRRR